ncbi:C-C motif chemokine 15 isoform X2 [Lontra canadensis]|uniref:C-C motif chemokine 15 isoform X2 n=1 Tax=Lontra canadensis TaxID=76717 RepID=UPI0013F2B4EF|nr:C-C motif chemokine 15 isoform X2 [Lontra canadensis]
MKVFVGALPFLILATALGSQVQVPHVLHHPADCCSSYTQQIRCAKMKDFFRTSSSCSRPGVIFLTKKERRICADPHVLEVQNCMRSLNNLMMRTGERGGFLEKKWF